MKITLFQNLSPSNCLKKELYQLLSTEGNLREGCDVSSPSILVDLSDEMISKGYEFETIVISDGNKYVQDDESKNVVVAIRESVLNASYAFVEVFNRYYFINRIVAVNNRLWRIDMTCDVLMSFSSDILKQKAFVLRSENLGSRLIKDNLISFLPETEIVEHYGNMQKSSDYLQDSFENEGYSEFTFGINVFTTLSESQNDNLSEIYPTGYSSLFEGVYSRQSSPTASSITYILKNYASLISLMNMLKGTTEKSVNSASYVFSFFSLPLNVKSLYVSGRQNHDLYEEKRYVQVGGDEYDLGADSNKAIRLFSQLSPMFTIDSFDIPSMTDFSQDSATTWAMYVPFVGNVELPYAEIQGHTIRLCYQIDFASCKANYFIVDVTSTRIIESGEADVIREISFSVDNSYLMNISKSMENFSTAFQIAGSATSMLLSPISMSSGDYGFSSGLGGIVSNVFSIAESAIKLSTVDARYKPKATLKSGSSTLSLAMRFTPLIYEIRQSKSISESDYADFVKLNGLPCNAVHPLSDLHGYAKIASINLEGFDSATENERIEVISSLQSGAIYPYN